jgi:hypothetical protein
LVAPAAGAAVAWLELMLKLQVWATQRQARLVQSQCMRR